MARDDDAAEPHFPGYPRILVMEYALDYEIASPVAPDLGYG